MKLLLSIFFSLFFLVSFGGERVCFPDELKQPHFSFEYQTWDFGKFKKTKKKSHTFVVTNDGEAPLLILHIATGCGCTTTSYTKEPIQPGSKGKITVQYDPSSQRPGHFRKSITVYTNSPQNYTRLFISGETTE